MQKIGELGDEGFTIDDLETIKENFEEKDFECELVNIECDDEDAEDAAILIIRKGVNCFVSANKLYKEQRNLDIDKKAFMYGRVVNKHARYNLCFANKGQEPDYENKKGRIIAYDDVPKTKKIKKRLHKVLGQKAKNLMLEANYYYDISKCGIGFHGDAERKKVVAIRLGETMCLVYQWYKDRKSIGEKLSFKLNHGDMYIMSEKATGFDWKKRKIATLRHAAGCDKFINKVKKVKK
jgi:hypothetical protein